MQFCVPQNYRTQKINQHNSIIGTKFLSEKEIATKLSLFDRIIERIDSIEKELPESLNPNAHKLLNYNHIPISGENSPCIDQKIDFPFSLVEFYPYRSNESLIKNKRPSKISSAEQTVQKEKGKKLSTPTKCISNRKIVAETEASDELEVNEKNKIKEEKILKQKIISIPKVPPLPPVINQEGKKLDKNNQNLIPPPNTLIQNKLSSFNEPKKCDDFLSDLIKSKKSLKRAEINVEKKQSEKESNFLEELKLRVKTRNENSLNLIEIEPETNVRNSIKEKSVQKIEKRPDYIFGSSSTSKYFTACSSSNKSYSTRSNNNHEEASLKVEQNFETKKDILDKSNLKKNPDSESFKISSSWTPSEDSDTIERRRKEIKSLLAMKNFLVPKSDKNNVKEPNKLIIKTESDESSGASIQINGLVTSKKLKKDKIINSRSKEPEPFSSRANDLLQNMRKKDIKPL